MVTVMTLTLFELISSVSRTPLVYIVESTALYFALIIQNRETLLTNLLKAPCFWTYNMKVGSGTPKVGDDNEINDWNQWIINFTKQSTNLLTSAQFFHHFKTALCLFFTIRYPSISKTSFSLNFDSENHQ